MRRIKKVIKVNWDLESDDDIDTVAAMPKCVEIPIKIGDDEVSDWVSDKFGWLVSSWQYASKNECKNFAKHDDEA